MPAWIGDRLDILPIWLAIGIAALAAVVMAVVLHATIFGLLNRLATSSESESDNIVVRKLRRPSRWAMIMLSLIAVSSIFPRFELLWNRVGGIVAPLFVGWMVIAILHALVEVMILRNDDSMADNRRARRRRTKLALFNRIATFVIVFVVVGLMLLAIPGVRDIGVTLVASAGLAGLAVGAAAQPALKSLIAGVQMAMTEPVIVGDAVVIAGEWGWIEEIRTTYVVVKIWDERRLVVPTSKFLEDTFQNWTKTTARLMGTIMLYVDPVTRLDPVRAKFEELVQDNTRWDGRVKHMQVTELTREAIEVRFLVTAKDSPTLYDLRCDIREALIQWLATEMPEAIVRNRVAPVAPLEIAGFPSGEALQQLSSPAI